tara:strand:+ start:1830 stop:2090 length:261 start_codon:yes stop_codon:yes gene_type:complete
MIYLGNTWEVEQKDKWIDCRSDDHGRCYYEMVVFDESDMCIKLDHYVICDCGKTWNLEYVKRCSNCDKELIESERYIPNSWSIGDY